MKTVVKAKNNKVKTGLSSIAAILAFIGFMTVVSTAIASETVQKEPQKVPAGIKYAGAGLAVLTAGGLLVLGEKYQR